MENNNAEFAAWANEVRKVKLQIFVIWNMHISTSYVNYLVIR